MSLIPRDFINELLARTDIVELIDARIPLRKAGANFMARCPFHEEKTPSFTVSAAKQFYHCFGCGKSGNAISFLMEHDHLDFVSTIESLATRLGVQIPRDHSNDTALSQNQSLYPLLEQVVAYYEQQLQHHPQAQTYLQKRGISLETIKNFHIGYAPEGWNNLTKALGSQSTTLSLLETAGLLIKKPDGKSYDRFRNRILFPIRDRRGRVIGFGGRIIDEGTPKYLNSPETPLFHKGKELYGLFETLQANRELQRVLVVEGYMDTVMLVQHGISFAVATLGTATTADHIQKLLKLTQDIIFCFDGDRAGRVAAWRALDTSLPLIHDGIQLRFLFLPEGEDPDSLVRKEGKDKFITRMNEALPLADFLFQQLTATIDLSKLDGRARLAKQANKYIQKIPPGVFHHMLLEKLAHHVRIEPSKLADLLKDTNTHPPHTPHVTKTPTRSQTPMRQAISLLLQHPTLINSLPDTQDITSLTLPGSTLLNDIITLLTQQPHLTTGTIIEHWRDQREYSQLLKLAAVSHLTTSSENLIKEFEHVLKQLKKMQTEQRVEQLMKKAHEGGLSQEEKQQLQTLIAENRTTS